MRKLLLSIIICCAGCGTAFGQNHYVGSVTTPSASWLKIDNDLVLLPAEAGTHYVRLNTNLDVTVTNRPSWLTITQTEMGVLRLVNKAYTGSTSRTATLTLTAKDGKHLSLKVTQMGSGLKLLLDREELEFYPDRLDDSLYVCASTTVKFDCPDWISVTKVTDSLYSFSAAEPVYDCALKQDTIKVTDGEGNVLKKLPANLRYYASNWYKKPCFAVISDIHFGDNNNQGWEARMPRVLKTLSAYDPQLQYIFIVGDVSNSGKEAEYQNVKAYFSNPELLNQNIKKIFVRGNHDWFNGTTGVSLYDKYISAQDNYYLTIQGYPFIALGLDNSLYRGETFNAETIKFLKESLADAAKNYPDKPIFVFTHTLPRNTVIGSYDSDYAAYDSNIDGIFSQYPQVINFSGHTHMGVMDPHQIYQLNYTAVNDGSQKSDSHPTKWPGRYHLGAEDEIDYNALTECLICHINEQDEVVIERWSTARNRKYAEDWIVSPPFDKTSSFKYMARNGGKNPWWESGAAIKVSEKTATSCHVTFPQAKDDGEGVNRYIIRATNSDGEYLMKDINQSALQYMCTDQPSEITMPLTGLPTGTPITVTVWARDYYEFSSSALTVTFTLTE